MKYIEFDGALTVDNARYRVEIRNQRFTLISDSGNILFQIHLDALTSPFGLRILAALVRDMSNATTY